MWQTFSSFPSGTLRMYLCWIRWVMREKLKSSFAQIVHSWAEEEIDRGTYSDTGQEFIYLLTFMKLTCRRYKSFHKTKNFSYATILAKLCRIFHFWPSTIASPIEWRCKFLQVYLKTEVLSIYVALQGCFLINLAHFKYEPVYKSGQYRGRLWRRYICSCKPKNHFHIRTHFQIWLDWLKIWY